MTAQLRSSTRPRSWKTTLAAIGPGILVMLADSDAGSIITASQSGAAWGYHLLYLQPLLVPILFIVQELTARLGLATGRGHGELLREHFGPRLAWFSCAVLLASCLGALVTEFSGMVGVGRLFGVPPAITMTLVVGSMMAVIWTAAYHSVERVAVIFGLFELAFLYVAFCAHPDPAALIEGARHLPFSDRGYLYLLSANIGSVVMPWMVFFQQSAIVEKKATPADLPVMRVEIALGAVTAQAVMGAVLVAAAATIGRENPGTPLETVQQISDTLTPFLGWSIGRLAFALGMTGAAMAAATVVALSAAWGVGEVAGYRRSLADHPRDAPWFYGVLMACLAATGAAVASESVNLVDLSIATLVLNALLLPFVLGFLFVLARRALPPPLRLRGAYAWVAAAVMVLTAVFGLLSALAGILG